MNQLNSLPMHGVSSGLNLAARAMQAARSAKIFAALAWFAVATLVWLPGLSQAQTPSADPAVSGANFNPGTIAVGEITTFNVTFTNSGSTDIPISSIEVTICPAAAYYTPNAAPTYAPGTGSTTTASLFTWVAGTDSCWIGRNTGGSVSAFDGGVIEIMYTGNTVTPLPQETVIRVVVIANAEAFQNAVENDEERPTLEITSAPAALIQPFISKAVAVFNAQTLTWTIVLDNNSNARVQNVLVRDPIPTGMNYLADSLLCQASGSSVVISCSYDSVNQRVMVDAALGSDLDNATPASAPNRVVITFRSTYSAQPVSVTNVAQACWDAQNNASNITACQASRTASAQYTPPLAPGPVSSPPKPIPVNSGWLLLLLMGVLSGLGMVFTSKRRKHA